MHLSNLPILCVASILFNAQHFHAHRPYVRGGKLPNPVVPPSPEKVVGTNWQLKEIHGVPAIPEPQELFFETERELSGYDGCNWFSGEWIPRKTSELAFGQELQLILEQALYECVV
eukprot:scaffold32177_cov90-Skeletonema_marinoi.AAC.5